MGVSVLVGELVGVSVPVGVLVGVSVLVGVLVSGDVPVGVLVGGDVPVGVLVNAELEVSLPVVEIEPLMVPVGDILDPLDRVLVDERDFVDVGDDVAVLLDVVGEAVVDVGVDEGVRELLAVPVLLAVSDLVAVGDDDRDMVLDSEREGVVGKREVVEDTEGVEVRVVEGGAWSS